jgi:hypothetical protein
VSGYRRRGACYLVCYHRPFRHARHYLGFAYPDDPGRADLTVVAEVRGAVQTRITCRWLTAEQAAGVACRIAQHRRRCGARILAVITEAGIGFDVVRIWPSATEHHEKGLKNLANGARLCPRCHPGTRAGDVITPRVTRRRRRPARQLVLAGAPGQP